MPQPEFAAYLQVCGATISPGLDHNVLPWPRNMRAAVHCRDREAVDVAKQLADS